MTKDKERALERLRSAITAKHALLLKDILLKYYEKDDQILITKDYWIVKKADEK